MNGPQIIRRPASATRKRHQVNRKRPKPAELDRRIAHFDYICATILYHQKELNHSRSLDGKRTDHLIGIIEQLLEKSLKETKFTRPLLVEMIQNEFEQKHGTNVVSLCEYRKHRRRKTG